MSGAEFQAGILHYYHCPSQIKPIQIRKGIFMPTFSENFGTMLHSRRLKRKLSQQQAAEALGIHMSNYAYFELGKILPEIEILPALKKLLRIPAKAFLHPERYICKKALRKWEKKNKKEEG